jgi:diacylglycerol kinase (ATP)
MNERPARKDSWWSQRAKSFVYAGRGLSWLIVTEPNARIHAVATLGVFGLGVWLRLSSLEWCAVSLAAGLVWTAEGLNSALEALADHVAPERHPQVGRAKDLAAGAVLAAAIIAAVVGVLVFAPKLWARLVE